MAKAAGFDFDGDFLIVFSSDLVPLGPKNLMRSGSTPIMFSVWSSILAFVPYGQFLWICSIQELIFSSHV